MGRHSQQNNTYLFTRFGRDPNIEDIETELNFLKFAGKFIQDVFMELNSVDRPTEKTLIPLGPDCGECNSLWSLSSDYIAVLDKDLEVLEANRSLTSKFGLSKGMHLKEKINPESLFLLKKEIYKFISPENKNIMPFEFLWEIKNESGSIFDRWLVKLDQIDENRFLLIGPSQQELYQLKEQLKVEMEMANMTSKLAGLGEMCAGVMHEISSPLMIIQGYANQIKLKSKNSNLTPTKLMYLGDKIEDSAQRIAKIIKSMRSLARNSGMDNMEIFNIVDSIEESLTICGDKFVQSGVRVFWEPLALPVSIHGDSTQISQVIINLLSNSIDAISDLNDKWIAIDADMEDETCRVRVTDSGSGIPEPLQKHLFQSFYTTKSKGKGTGLGLSISQRIIKKHRGQLYLGRNNPNTQFIIDLPLA